MKESQENYLETILMISKTQETVRAIDIAKALNYSKPSISRAMKLLKEQGLIIIKETGEIELTTLGVKKAESVYERHIYITKFLKYTLNIDEKIAEIDACKIEHIISDAIFIKMKERVELYEKENKTMG